MYYAVNTTLNTIVHVHAEGVARDSVRVWGVDLMENHWRTETWLEADVLAFDEFVGTLEEAIAYATLRYKRTRKDVKAPYVDLYDKGEYSEGDEDDDYVPFSLYAAEMNYDSDLL